MLDADTKRRIDSCRDILVGKVPDPKSQVEQITIALIYKFMDDMDAEAEELGGSRTFFAGEYARYGWAKLMAPSLGGFEVLGLYSEAIQKMNENPGVPELFRDIFKNAYLPYRDPETLKSFLKEINYFSYDHSERLGDAFEYLLSVLGSQGDAGQFRTPRHIIDFMVEVLDPKKNETILDPACGTAGFLISAWKHILKTNTGKTTGDKLTPDERARLAGNIKGYDISPDMVRLSLVNLYLHGFSDPHIVEYDTLTSDEKWNEVADVILANPPFMSPKGGIKPHKRFSVQASRSEVLFVDYMAEHLTATGRAAIVVPEGIIFQSGTAYKALRKMLVDTSLVAVVSLPAGVFNPSDAIYTESKGDFWLTQQLCQTICTMNNVLETLDEKRNLPALRAKVVDRLRAAYYPPVKEFSRGRRFRSSNDPYFKLLRAVSMQESSIVDVSALANSNPEVRGSINNIKDHRLGVLLHSKPACARHFYYNTETKSFAIEDPALFYFLKHLDWEKLRTDCGFKDDAKDYEYDFAISFAGENRALARHLAEQLEVLDASVFYDENFEANFLGKTWSTEFKRIFGDASRVVVCLLDCNHLKKIWPTFERECFTPRVTDGDVIPIYLDDTKFVAIPQDTVGIMFKVSLEGEDWKNQADDVVFKLMERIA